MAEIARIANPSGEGDVIRLAWSVDDDGLKVSADRKAVVSDLPIAEALQLYRCLYAALLPNVEPMPGLKVDGWG